MVTNNCKHSSKLGIHLPWLYSRNLGSSHHLNALNVLLNTKYSIPILQRFPFHVCNQQTGILHSYSVSLHFCILRFVHNSPQYICAH